MRRVAAIVQGRLEACLRAWPARLTREARRYFSASLRAASAPARAAAPSRAYWLSLPIWLHQAAGARSRAADRRFLADVLWGQYALFLFIRIHDDLVDGQASSPWLVYVADRLLVESERALARHLDGRFWPIFRRSVSDTLDGIAEADALQQRRHPPPAALLRAYARVSSIFKVGAAAVCARDRRLGAFPRLSAFADELAIAGQIADDLLDVEEDLARGRRNYVAATLLAREGAAGGRRQSPLARIGHRILRDDGLAPVLSEMERRLKAARTIVAPLGLAQADRHVARLERQLVLVRRDLQRARVERLFGHLLR